ncbi:hypothetical protein OAP17_10475 [Porticoccaceae bacterium]|jgi:preprotein translocase subunit SecA|nr:hypothetical protein [Porticoccaceae bacterium]
MSEYVQKKPILTGLRNEKSWQISSWLDIFIVRTRESLRKLINRLLRRDERLVKAIMARSDLLSQCSEAELQQLQNSSRDRLKIEGINRSSIIESFALVREVSGRVLGMRHHHTQIRVSVSLLRGCIAEMATGEGKTLAATLACATAALAGVPVHMVTINDYLAQRDGEEMTPLYQALGLSVGIVTHEAELLERRQAYACDICFCSNKELTFDFLKDRLVLDGRENSRVLQAAMLTKDSSWSGRLLLRGLHFAVVDEADSVLVDEARTPLIISGEEIFGLREEALLKQAMDIASTYQKKLHFEEHEDGSIHITPRGDRLLVERSAALDGLWRSSFYREPLVRQALSAMHIYQLDRDYIVDEEGLVQIVDPHTGRVMPGRSWGQGLQQMIEMKEGVELTKPRETNAEISYQNFFRKYHHLSGMTGTVTEVAREILDVYRLRSEAIPLLKVSQRKRRFNEVYPTEAEKLNRIVSIVSGQQGAGQPTLIGTNSVSSSEAISEVLSAEGIAHTVLNARQDEGEAGIVALAGELGAVTVATSMAGRGTDIKLSQAAKDVGGLHVIVTELQDARRIDRQLAGRSARQGDPGMVSEILSMEDRLIKKVTGPLIDNLTALFRGAKLAMPNWLGMRVQKRCQRTIENSHYRQRLQLIKSDGQRQRTMAFAGEKK